VDKTSIFISSSRSRKIISESRRWGRRSCKHYYYFKYLSLLFHNFYSLMHFTFIVLTTAAITTDCNCYKVHRQQAQSYLVITKTVLEVQKK